MVTVKQTTKVKVIDYKGNSKVVYVADERDFDTESPMFNQPLFTAEDEFGNIVFARKEGMEVLC